MHLKSSNYTGTGIAGNAITGVGFQPLCVIIKARTGSHKGQITMSTMGANLTKNLVDSSSNGLTAGLITSLDSDGFTLGASTEVNGVLVYDYFAMGNNGGAATDIAVGSYAGDGNNPHAITGLAFPPGIVIIANNSASLRCYFATVDMPSGNVATFGAAISTSSQAVISLDSGGFTLGTSTTVNGVGTTYYYVAIKTVGSFVKTVTYTGDGLDNVNIGGVGFIPDNVWTKNDAQTVAAAFRGRTEAGDLSTKLDGTNEAADRIQALQADGFQVGTTNEVNSSTRTFYAAAFKDGTTVFPPLVSQVSHFVRQAPQRAATR